MEVSVWKRMQLYMRSQLIAEGVIEGMGRQMLYMMRTMRRRAGEETELPMRR